MRIIRAFLFILAVSLAFGFSIPAHADLELFKKDEILIKLKKNAPITGTTVLSALSTERARRILSGRDADGIYKLALSPGETVEDKVKAALNDPGVELAQPNYIYRALFTTPDDQYFSLQWGMLNTGQRIFAMKGKPNADIRMPETWSRATGSKAIVVAVIDTGIDYNHPDLAANVWVNPAPGTAGFAGDIHGINVIVGSGDPFDDSQSGHGSHVSGTIGAVGNNGIGVCGMSWNVSIMALKFLDSTGSGTTDGAIQCINYAVTKKKAGINIRVINASWGGTPGTTIDPLLQAAVQSASDNEIIFVAAAGNDGRNNDRRPVYPASFNIPGVIAVAASNMRDRLAHFSDFGRHTVHVAAPGVNILSTVPTALPVGTGNIVGYTFKSGTSMATPHVAGLAALTASANTSLTAAQIKALIVDNVDFLNLPLISGGRVNAARTVGAALGDNVTLSVTREVDATVMQATVFAQGALQPGVKVFFYKGGIKRGKSFTGDLSSANPGIAILRLKDSPGDHKAFAVSAPFGDVQSMSSNTVLYTVP